MKTKQKLYEPDSECNDKWTTIRTKAYLIITNTTKEQVQQ